LRVRSSWEIQKSVIYALFLREVNVRFSAGKIGYIWIFLEPLLQILVFVTVKLLLFGKNSTFDYAVFITVGFIAYNLFRHIVNSSMSAFKSNKALFAYKQVKPIDTLIARLLVEIMIMGVISLVFIGAGFYFSYDMNPQNLGMVLITFIWLILFSFGLGLFVSVIGFFFTSFSKVVKLAMMPLMFISAIFYTLEDLPPSAQELLAINPLVHFMELIHASYFYSLTDQFVNYTYILMWTAFPLYIGLKLYIRLSKAIVSK
jgi:capsular polysaccharide transport system permease protein